VVIFFNKIETIVFFGILAGTYTVILAALVWARFKYFKVDTRTAEVTRYFYDPFVTLHILATCFHFYTFDEIVSVSGLFAIILYFIGATLFILTVSGSSTRGYAFSKNIDKLITSGTYRLVRHPLYLSYSLIWTGSAILFNSLFLWITLAYLLVFYIVTAIKEEKTISISKHSREYDDYRRNVGMFLPRIRGWKS